MPENDTSNVKADQAFPKHNQKSVNVARALDVLRGQSMEPQELLKLAKLLKEEKQFGLARRLLARPSGTQSQQNPKLRLEIHQQSALCTYKDPDLQADALVSTAPSKSCVSLVMI